MTAVVPGSQLTRQQAENLTQQLRNALDRAYGLIEQAYKTRCDIAMGYDSWAEYVAGEFGPEGLAVPKADRAKVIALFDLAGMTQRAIAAATGVSQPTVFRELAATDSNESVDAPPPTKTGLDGKTRAARKPANTDKPINPTGFKKSWKNRTKFNTVMADLNDPTVTDDLTRDEIFAAIKVMEETITALKGNL